MVTRGNTHLNKPVTNYCMFFKYVWHFVTTRNQIVKKELKSKNVAINIFQCYWARGKVKHELPVAGYEFRLTNYKFKSTSYEFKSTSYEFRSVSYEFISTRQEIKNTSKETKSTSWEKKSTGWEIQSISWSNKTTN